MTNKKYLTFMVPCYNGEKYIQRFLDAVLQQTYPWIELVIVNDGSTDRTEDIIKQNEKQFEARGYKLVYLKQENGGIGAALNNALKYVTGEYLTWFGADDFAAPSYAEELVGFLEANPEYAVVRSEGYLVDEKDVKIVLGKFSSGNTDKHNPHLFENAIMEKGFHFGYSVVRMDVFNQVNPRREIYPSRQGQNWQLLLPVFYAHKSAFYDKPLYYVVDNVSSVSRDPHKHYGKAQAQNQEYERILINTLNSMDIPDRDRYLCVVKLKYIRRRMCTAINFGKTEDAIREYQLLKEMNCVDWIDRIRYLRAKVPFLEKLINRIK